MVKPQILRIIIVSFILLISVSSLLARAEVDTKTSNYMHHTESAAAPPHAIVAHKIGKISLGINNNGTFGDGFALSVGMDYISGLSVPSCEYPRGSNLDYLFAGAFWVGAIVGRDTLVSVAADGWSAVREFSPVRDYSVISDSGAAISKRSISFPDEPGFLDAVSEEDYIMQYNDLETDGVQVDYFGKAHTPLDIHVTQKSYAWSYPYAEDFVLFDYEIKNIGRNTLTEVYMGVYVDGDVGFTGQDASNYWNDDLSGFLDTVRTTFNQCEYVDTVFIAWLADNNGDPTGTRFDEKSPSSVTGTRIVRTPADSLRVSFNWWISSPAPQQDFGPRERSEKGRWKEEFRDFRTGGLGTPEGDVNKYYIMRNQEFDYDQAYTASIQANDPLWLEPLPDEAANYSTGYDTRYLLSFGPFNVDPGERLPISFAYVAGENFHKNINNLDNLPDNPDLFYKNLGFDDLGLNSAWAARVYDNPGVDTDGDGYFGKFRVCCADSTLSDSLQVIDTTQATPDTSWSYIFDYSICDTLYYEGDGVPDFQGASPPPAPKFYLEPSSTKIHVRFNGFISETAKDVFSRINDFEGYRVYLARDDRSTSFSMTASYDVTDFNKYVWNPYKVPFPDFELNDIPFDLDSLRCLYGESCDDSLFDPESYSRTTPFQHPNFPDSLFFFEPQDFNASEFGFNTPIRKVYPNQPFPSSLDMDSVSTDELTEEGDFKYFEYQVEIENLLPTVPYWVNVTAFDFGSPESDLKSLESSIVNGAKMVYALDTPDPATDELNVYVYPNPYKYDGNYRDQGLEGRIDNDRSDDKVRAIHFANLPPKCTIKIYSVDGDLIREIDHDKDPNDPTSMIDEWDIITRNTQLTVSGLYYWVIETDDGRTQIGRLAIIM